MKHETKRERTARFYANLAEMGFSFEESETLRRAEMALSRWSERECNGEIQRDERTGIPYIYSTFSGKRIGRAADREKGALSRVKALVESKPGLVWFHQGDPRGCALYVGRAEDLRGESIHCAYSRLFAVCI